MKDVNKTENIEEIDWSKITIKSSFAANYKIYTTNTPNYKIYIGDECSFHVHLYIRNPPNRFQRWLYQKILGIRWERSEQTT